jgi:23S rRNA (pseudouridine1915-N3)-methyltransferase
MLEIKNLNVYNGELEIITQANFDVASKELILIEGEREKTKRQEAEAILKRVPADAVLILLDERGVERTSEDFSLFIERMASFGRELVFVLGGGLGTDQVIKERANHVVALSKLTFPHNLARIFLEEQIYRACTIIAGKEYHK